MKNVGKIGIAVIIGAVIFTSCAKDPVDLENSYSEIIYETDDGFWVEGNELRTVFFLSPNSITGEMVDITYSSEADTIGFTVESAYYNTTLESGRTDYNIQQIDRWVKAAAFTNANKNFLKINPDGDVITIKVGDNIYTETVSFEGKYSTLLTANFGISGNGYWNGSIRYYNEEGLKPDITMYSESHPTPVTISPNTDLGDEGYRAADPETSLAFGHAYYSLNLVYNEETGSGYGNEIIVNNDSDIIYVELDGNTYSFTYNGESLYKEILRPVN